MKRKTTLLSFWEKLTPKQLRLIHDLIRSGQWGIRPNINMGALPFVPVDEVIRLLRSEPYSPWTLHLYDKDRADDRNLFYDEERCKFLPHRKSYENDKRDYAEIIAILTTQTPKLATLLQQWKEANQ